MKPSSTLLRLLGALLVVAIVLGTLDALSVAVPERLTTLWWGALLLLTLAALTDALRLRRLPSPRLHRQLPGNLPLGRWSEVRLSAEHALSLIHI